MDHHRGRSCDRCHRRRSRRRERRRRDHRVRRWWSELVPMADVSGQVSVMAVWTGEEQASFQAVIDEFTKLYPNVTVNYTSAGDQLPTVLSTAVQGGNPPSVAAVAQPGLMTDFVNQGVLKPLDFASEEIRRQLLPQHHRGGDRGRHAVRPAVQGRQQVAPSGTTSRRSRTPASTAPMTWDELLQCGRDPERLRREGVLHRRRRRLDAHRPVREHLPAHGRSRHVRPADGARHPLDR